MICGWWYIWDIEHMARTCQCLLLLYSLVVVCALRSHCVVSRIQCICEVSASSALSSPLGSLGDWLTCCRVACKHCTTRSSDMRHEFSAIDSQSCGSPPQLISKPVQWKQAAVVRMESFEEDNLTGGRTDSTFWSQKSEFSWPETVEQRISRATSSVWNRTKLCLCEPQGSVCLSVSSDEALLKWSRQ